MKCLSCGKKEFDECTKYFHHMVENEIGIK